MAITNVPYGLNRTTNSPIDPLFLNGNVPFTNVAQANSIIVAGIRHIGLFVNVNYELYWYKNGTTDGDLVSFAASGATGAAGGDLSGTYPNPTVAKFNGQLPSYYLDYNNLTNKPTLFSGDYNDLSNLPDLSIYQQLVDKGQPDGYVPLDSGGKIDTVYLPDSILGQIEYQGTWNADSNTPTLPDASTVKGHYYIVNNDGIYGGIDYVVGDWVISDGVDWTKVDNTDSISSFNGRTGAITLTSLDVTGALTFTPVTNTRTITINGTTYDLSANRSWTVGDLLSSGSYSNPSWLTSLAWSKITGTPTTLSGYGITNAYTQTQINNFFSGTTSISGYNKTAWDSLYGIWSSISPNDFVGKWETWNDNFNVTGSTIIHIVDGNEYFNSTPYNGYFAIGDISGTNGYSNIVAYQNSLNINSYYQTFNSSGSIILGDVNGNSRGTIITIDTNSNIININAASLFDTQKNSPYITDIDVQGYGFVTNSFLNTTLNNYATLNTTQTFTASKTFNYDTFFANTTSLKWGQGTTYIKGNSTGNLLEFYTNNSVSGYFDVNKNLFLNGKLSIGTTNTELLEVSAVSSSIPKISVNVTSGSHDAGSGFVIKSGGSERGGITANMSTGEVRMGAIGSGSFFTTIYSNATEVIRILPNGSVGLFMTNPIAKLDILDTTLSGSGSLSGSILNLAQTWNTTGNPTAIKLNVTNTASGASSKLLDLQVGGSSKFIVDKNGNVGIGTTAPSALLTLPSTGGLGWEVSSGTVDSYLERVGTGRIVLSANSASDTTSGMYVSSRKGMAANAYFSMYGVNVNANDMFNGARAGTIVLGSLVSSTATANGYDFSFWTGTTAGRSEKMTITKAGNVGIGTASPVSTLQVLGTATFGAYGGAIDTARDIANFYINNASNAGIVRFMNAGAGQGLQTRFIAGLDGTSQTMFTDSTNWIGAVAVTGSNANANNNSMQFRLRGTADANSEAGLNASAKMTILGSGNVGIGTTTPAYKLDVNGTGRFVSDLTANSFIKSGGTSTQFLKADGTIDTNTYLTTSLAASTYQPLENQRLRTTDNVQFSSIRANDGTNGVYYFGINGKLVYTSSATTDTNLYFRYNGVNDTPLLTPINVDTYLTNYVTKDTTQTITGAKTFTNDVEVDNLNGITFNKHSVGPVYLKGDGSTVNDGGNYVLKTDVNYFGNIITEEFLSYGIASANFYSLKINYADVSTQTWVLNKNYLSGTINTWINDSISLGRFYFSGNSTTYYKGYGDGVTNPYHEFRDNNNNTKLKIHDVYSIFTDDVGAFSLFTRNPLNNSNYGPSWKFGFSTNLGCSSGMETPINILTGSESLSQVIDKVNEIISKVNSITTTLFSNNKKISVEVNNNIFELLTINDNWC